MLLEHGLTCETTTNLQKPPRIQPLNPRTLRLPLKNKLTHQLPRRATILDAPTRMARRQE